MTASKIIAYNRLIPFMQPSEQQQLLNGWQPTLLDVQRWQALQEEYSIKMEQIIKSAKLRSII